MSKVFVVTPTYCTDENRRLPLLLQTIYWAQQQTHKDYLHIVVDDGSTDSTPEVLERLSRSDPNLKVFRKENGGSSAAVNYGVAQALALDRPDYITICHSDDVLLPDSLDVRVQVASTTGAGLVYTDEVVVNDRSAPPKIRPAREHSTPDKLFSALLEHVGIPYVTMLWDADFFLHRLHGYDDRLTSSEDWDIALRSAKELATIQGTHATAHSVTVARREHENRLRPQNLRDGTKQRCYEMIFRKHLEEDEYQAAMVREKLTRLQRPKLLARMKEGLHDLQRPKILHDTLLQMRQKRRMRRLRRAPPTETELDPRTEAFLQEMDRVDYGFMVRRAA